MLAIQLWMVTAAQNLSVAGSILHANRSSAGDLEVGGELAGLPKATVRYVRYDDLLKLPQETYSLTDDTNFKGQAEVTGVPLTTLARLFGQAAHSDLIVAICSDRYRSNYPSEYLTAHDPILVLKINGQTREKWRPSEYGTSLGPYLISHPPFHPSFSVLSHKDEAQRPFAVTRLEFRSQAVVYGAIKPPGEWSEDSPVWQGYRVAREDCYRCHNQGPEGGELAHYSWRRLAAGAARDGRQFEHYVHKPTDFRSRARMPAHPEYDDATLMALTAYFRTFNSTRTAR